MKKVVLLFIMVVTIIWTMPSIYMGTDSTHIYTLLNQSTPKITMHTPKQLSNSSPPSSNSIPFSESKGNTTNQGLAIEDKERIYYSDGIALWSINKDGTLTTKIIDEAYPINIQVLGDVIYYINENTHEIHRINKDGTQSKKISNDMAYSLNIYKDNIYFIDRYNKLYITSMSLEGEHKTVIKEVIANDMVIYNDYIYYVTGTGNLGKVKIDGSSNMIIKTDIMQFDVARTGIYYVFDPRKADKPRGLYYLDFDKDEQIQLMNETPYSFNAHGDVIYYNHPSKLNLYSMLSNGTQKTQITGVNTAQINIAGNYIFYRNLEDGKKIYRVNLDGTGRTSLQGKTLITNVTDITKEINDLEGKEIAPKLERTYNYAREIIAKIIKPYMTEYEKAKVVHDYVVNNTRYDIEAAQKFLQGEDSDANSFMAYGVLINQTGVCQGYAEATQILLSLAGIQSEFVIGEAGDEEGGYISHMWNIVLIDDEYYMMDTTWDDPVGPKDILLHDYFLIDDDTLKKTHRWAYDEYPPCNLNRSELN